MNSHTPVPPQSPDAVLLEFDALDQAKLLSLGAELRSSEAFTISAKRCERIGEVLRMQPTRVAELLQMLKGLYDYRHGKPGAHEIGDRSIRAILSTLDHLPLMQPTLDRIAGKLENLIKRDPTLDRATKLERLRAGLVKNAVGFSSMVDLRPDFPEDRSSIRSLLPVIQMRITTDAQSPAERTFVFQMNRTVLEELRKALADIDVKLSCIEQDGVIGKLIVEPGDIE